MSLKTLRCSVRSIFESSRLFSITTHHNARLVRSEVTVPYLIELEPDVSIERDRRNVIGIDGESDRTDPEFF